MNESRKRCCEDRCIEDCEDGISGDDEMRRLGEGKHYENPDQANKKLHGADHHHRWMFPPGNFVGDRMNFIEPQDIDSETECAEKREYISDDDFLDGIGMN